MSPETIIPAPSTTMDLRAMLELIQAAADPKKAKAFLDKIDDARAELDGKIVEIAAREKAAVALEERADKAVAKQEAATNKALTEQANLAAMKQALTTDEEALKAHKATLDLQAVEQARRCTELDNRELAFRNEMDVVRSQLAKKAVDLDAKIADLESAKAALQVKEADLNARLEKLRALAE